MTDIPPCHFCGEKGVVKVNSFGACKDHIDRAFRAAFNPLRQALNEAINRRP